MYLTRPENAVYALDGSPADSYGCTSIAILPRTFNCCGRSESWPGHSRDDAVHEHARHACHRDRREIGPRVVEDEDVRLYGGRRLRGAWCAARRERQSHRRHGGRRARGQRISRRIQSKNRRAFSGVSTRFRNLAIRTSARGPAIHGRPEAPRPGTPAPTMPTRIRCSGAPAIPGRITSTITGRATTLFGLGAGARSGHRKTQVALSVHAARHARLGLDTEPGAG